MIRRIFIRLFPRLGLQLIYFRNFGRFANIRKPVGLYEKLMWLNFNEDPAEKARLSDKLLAREHLSELGLGKYLNDLYGVYDSAEDINFSELPSSCMLKCTHGANYNIPVHDFSAADINEAKEKLAGWLGQDYSLNYAELHYRAIKPRIICEKYLGKDIVDYKVYCINGNPEYVMVCAGRCTGTPMYYFYTFDWEYRDLLTNHHPDPCFERPPLLEELYELSSRLSAGRPFVRVDTYIHEGRLIFGEMTFTPGGFIDIETLPEVKEELGRMIRLPSFD